MVYVGKVSDVNKEKLTVKVLFEALDNMVSDDLLLLFPPGVIPNQYSIPKIGQDVVCMFLPSSNDGVCLGCYNVKGE